MLTSFQIPSMHEEFGSTSHDPVYHFHSVYDSEAWQEKYGDPGFFKHVRRSLHLLDTTKLKHQIFQITIAQHLGIQIMRMATAPLLPFNTTHYSLQLEVYLDAYVSSFSASSLPN